MEIVVRINKETEIGVIELGTHAPITWHDGTPTFDIYVARELAGLIYQGIALELAQNKRAHNEILKETFKVMANQEQVTA